MDPSTEILFNSPALHSLKRAQLLQLCKRYSIKQSGKNEELVTRLRHYSQDLLDQTSQLRPEHVEAPDAAQPGYHVRTSQQWELVEGDIQEDQNSTLPDKRTRTLSIKSIGGMSTRSGTSVSSSLMSIANSLKRVGSKNSKLSTRSTNSMSTTSSLVKQPLSHLFPSVPASAPVVASSVQTSSIETKGDDSVVEAIEAEANTSDDLTRPIIDGQVDGTKLNKEQTTVRLVTPEAFRLRSNASHPTVSFPTPILKPFHLALQSEPSPNEEIGRAFLNMDARSFTETMQSGDESADVSLDQATLNPAIFVDTCTTPTRSSLATVSKSDNGLLPPSATPFIFGSPANAVSNAEFGQAAAAVLEEMNKRLGLDLNATGAARIGVDGKFEFGEVTPTRASLIDAGKKDDGGRYGKAHERVFDKMESIADYHNTRRAHSPVKPATSLAGTKRKSTFNHDEAVPAIVGKRIICLDDPKDKTMAPPAPKRQKVDGAELAKMEKANINAIEKPTVHVKEDEANLKKLAGAKERRRNSLGRRSNAAGSNARRKSIAQAKAAPSGRLGLLRGAAKVMKSIISTVSHPASAPAPSTNAKVPAATVVASSQPVATAVAPSTSSSTTKPSTGTAAIAPKPKKPSIPGGHSARPSTLVSRTGSAATSARNTSASTNRTGTSSLAPKAANVQRIRGSNDASARGKLPVFPDAILAVPGARTSSRVSAATAASSRRSSNMSTSTNTSAMNKKPLATRTTSGSTLLSSTISSQARLTAKGASAASSVKSKMSIDSVPELERKSTLDRDVDFEPAMPGEDEDGARPDSPLPTPPASLSSRPLQKRAPLEPTQPATEASGSMGRKPRISRSKVIAKVHASREDQQSQTSKTSVGRKSVGVIGSTKTRKSIGVSVSAKTRMMGGECAVKARASIAADAAKRKARLSEAVAARQRTLALQAKV